MIQIYFDDRMLLISEVSNDFDNETVRHIFNEDEPIADVLQAIAKSEHGARLGLRATNEAKKLEQLATCFEVVQAAGGLVRTAAGEVLLMFRRGKWDLPKGKVDEGERIEACAVREVEEETGVAHLTLGHHLLTTYHTYEERGKKILKESHWFHMQVPEATPLIPQTEEDIEQCLWVPAAEVPSYLHRAHASVADVLKRGLSGTV